MPKYTEYEKSEIVEEIPALNQVYYFPLGRYPFKVTKICGFDFEGCYLISGSYCSSKYGPDGTDLRRAVRKLIKDDTKENTMNDKTLYEIKGAKKTSYAHYLATNSEGLWVMEDKGTGKVFSVDKDEVSKVVPNCIGVRFLSGGTNTQVYHYLAPKDTYKVGEVYTMLSQSGISLVSIAKEDCESDQATKDFKPIFKMLMEKVDKG